MTQESLVYQLFAKSFPMQRVRVLSATANFQNDTSGIQSWLANQSPSISRGWIHQFQTCQERNSERQLQQQTRSSIDHPLPTCKFLGSAVYSKFYTLEIPHYPPAKPRIISRTAFRRSQSFRVQKSICSDSYDSSGLFHHSHGRQRARICCHYGRCDRTRCRRRGAIEMISDNLGLRDG